MTAAGRPELTHWVCLSGRWLYDNDDERPNSLTTENGLTDNCNMHARKVHPPFFPGEEEEENEQRQAEQACMGATKKDDTGCHPSIRPPAADAHHHGEEFVILLMKVLSLLLKEKSLLFVCHSQTP